jgi:hypothetical protein
MLKIIKAAVCHFLGAPELVAVFLPFSQLFACRCQEFWPRSSTKADISGALAVPGIYTGMPLTNPRFTTQKHCLPSSHSQVVAEAGLEFRTVWFLRSQSLLGQMLLAKASSHWPWGLTSLLSEMGSGALAGRVPLPP